MDIKKMVKMALACADISEAELARRLGTSASALNQRVMRGSLGPRDLADIAAAIGAEFVCLFRFPDGTEV
ncbi:MAG: XRE family transcriptional regulator [Oscillospiraceae bacterium]|jgi:DNA-binding transcriptional regulator YdaS (Cro superfamily)|nr:XRE family transcriptional regulator [Oscillospiraceae bacterium]